MYYRILLISIVISAALVGWFYLGYNIGHDKGYKSAISTLCFEYETPTLKQDMKGKWMVSCDY